MNEESFNEIMNDFNEQMDKLIMDGILERVSNEKLQYSEIRNNLKVFVDAIQVKKNNAAEIIEKYEDLVKKMDKHLKQVSDDKLQYSGKHQDLANLMEIITKADQELHDKYYTKMIEELGLQCFFDPKPIK